MDNFIRQLKREWKLAMYNAGDWIGSLIFFFMPPFLFALASGGTPVSNIQQALAIIIVASLLSLIAGLDRLLRSDWQCGYFDQLRLRPGALFSSVFAKLTVFAVTLMIPLAVLGPLLVHMVFAYTGSWQELYILSPVLLLFGACLALLGILLAALSVSARQSSVLLFVLLFPLAIPLVIFTLATADALLGNQDWYKPLTVLIAFFMVALMTCPVAACYVIEQLDD